MKIRLRRLLCAALCLTLCLLCIPQSTAAPSVTLTAVNDSFLPLSASTMPTRVGGAQYVPYTVFTGALGVSASYSAAEHILTLSSGATSLRFGMDTGTVYDQNMKSYTTPAYSISGTIYVPVKLVCGKFGLTYSNISAAAPILRICSQSASQSDAAFVTAMSGTIRSMLDSYNGGTGSTSGGDTDSTADPLTGQPAAPPAHKPETVYLTYLGTPDGDTPAILDALADAGLHATFFLTADGTSLDGDLLRRIVGEGHAVGFVLLSDAQDMAGKLRAANDQLFAQTGTVSRLVCISDGASHLTGAQQQTLSQAGYRIWDTTLDSRDHSLTAPRAAREVVTACGQTDAPVVLRMGHYGATARVTQLTAGYLSQNHVPTARITLARTPVA